MRLIPLVLTLLVLDRLVAGNMSTLHVEDFLGGALPQLPAGFAPEAEALPPMAGGDVPSSSSCSQPPDASPQEPREGPAPAPGLGGGIPFISSNPAVPLPAAETDTANLHPLPTPGHSAQEMVVGHGTRQRVRMPLMLATIIIMWSAFGFCS